MGFLLRIIFLFSIMGNLYSEWKDLLVEMKDKNSFSTIESIDFIYMINLDRRPSRWKMSIEALKEFDIAPYRVSAIDGWKLNDKFLKKHSIQLNQRKEVPRGSHLNLGGLGATLSHLSVIRDAVLSDYDMIWVMEDDIKILSDPRQLKGLIEELNQLMPEWDMLYTDCWKKRFSMKEHKETTVSEHFIQQSFRFGAYSYILKKSGLRKVWEYFQAHGIRNPIDDEFNLVPDLVKVCLKPEMISFKVLGSDTAKFRGADPTSVAE